MVPATLGAIWAWPEAITFALLVPGLISHMLLSRRSAQSRGVDGLPRNIAAIVGGCAGLLAFVLAVAVGPNFAPLAIVLCGIVVVEPVWRVLCTHERMR